MFSLVAPTLLDNLITKQRTRRVRPADLNAPDTVLARSDVEHNCTLSPRDRDDMSTTPTTVIPDRIAVSGCSGIVRQNRPEVAALSIQLNRPVAGERKRKRFRFNAPSKVCWLSTFRSSTFRSIS